MTAQSFERIRASDIKPNCVPADAAFGKDSRPGLLPTAYSGFSTDNSTFVLHPGLVACLNLKELSIYERYSGITEVVVTVIIALLSAAFAGICIFRMRRKNRIGSFYTEVIATRTAVSESSSEEERAAAARKIRELRDKTLELLVDEKLSADESCRICFSLSNDALHEIEAHGAQALSA